MRIAHAQLHVYRLYSVLNSIINSTRNLVLRTERRHGSTRVMPSLRMVVYICYITEAGNSISSQLGSSAQQQVRRRRQAVPSITYKTTPAGSLSSSQPGGPPCLGQSSSLRPHWLRTSCSSLISHTRVHFTISDSEDYVTILMTLKENS